ncbi:MAG: hypothetical protein K0Q95_1142 [Bacteroidota bacterium]|jgi:hypothetical protein|nr:hypothetical protein [Bacteroidota bacterium]
MNLVFEYPWYFSLFCLLAGFVYAFLLYRKDSKFNDSSVWLVRGMAALRFLAVTILSFLLLSPLLKTVNRQVEKPIIIIAQDNSQSLIINKDSAFYKLEYKQRLSKLIDDLKGKYNVVSYSFADKVKGLNDPASLSFNDKQTDISLLFDEIDTRYGNRNVGAVIVATDGLYNKGANPVYSAADLKIPLYTIALGDTTIKKDLILSRVDHNRIAYLGNQFPLEILVNAKQLKGKTSTLSISKGNANLFSQIININSETFTLTVPALLEAKEVGLQHYKVRVSALDDEVSKLNNVQDIFVDVLDARQRILILADAPHPDVAAIKDALQENQNYEVESYSIDQFDKSVKKYNLVILHQLPSPRTTAAKVLSELNSSDVPVWSFSGAKALLKRDLTLGSVSPKTNECEPVIDENFPLFTISDELRKAMKDFPAVTCPFGSYQTDNSSNVLLYQRIGIVDTKTPLMLFNNTGDSKVAVFTGEGIWKWRLQDFAANGNHDLFNELISKTVQYLSVKVDKSFFRVIGKNNFMENEAIEMEAEVYNQSYELINEPEVSVVIKNAADKKFQFTFGKTSNAYRLNAGMLPVGEYKYDAKVKVGEKIYEQHGEFSVSALQVEFTNTTADHQMLYALAQKHDGEMVYPADMTKLSDKLNAREDIKSVSYSEKKLRDMINLQWIFFVILALISAEWFMRKRNGAY